MAAVQQRLARRVAVHDGHHLCPQQEETSFLSSGMNREADRNVPAYPQTQEANDVVGGDFHHDPQSGLPRRQWTPAASFLGAKLKLEAIGAVR